jgi:PAS domain S-box-containing protein
VINAAAWSAWFAAGDITVLKLTPQESAGLIMLAATLLVFRTFRGRYLLLWILGWLAFLVSRWPMPEGTLTRELVAISHAEFILAVCLFAAAVFVYTEARDLLLPLIAITAVVMGYAALRAMLWPESPTLRIALEVAYRLIAVVAAIQLIRFRWARWEIGPWLLGSSLLLLHLDWAPFNVQLPPGTNLVAEIIFGLSMLLIVFDDSRMRTRRLAVVNALTTSISRAQQHGPMMLTALEELKGLMSARAAWFRLQDGVRMVIVQQIGLSADFQQAQGSVVIDDTMREVLQSNRPTVIRTAIANESIRSYLRQEGFHHVVMIPVVGKKSVIGTLSLGSRRRLLYTAEEMDFLATSAHQLGLAVENLRLVEQILRSQRQWINTFDSIQDLILVHDPDFRIIRANHALLQRLGQSLSDLADKPCDEVLPRENGPWQSCPYCQSGDGGYHEGQDPCFGGFVMVSTSASSEQGGKQKGIIHVVRDITDRRQAEEKYRLLFEQVQEGVFLATPDGKLLDCNDAFIRMLGYGGREDVMALNIDTELYASPEQREAFRREVELHNYVRNFEVTLRRKDGTLLSALENSFASRDSNDRARPGFPARCDGEKASGG